jgi:hypothetical protein
MAERPRFAPPQSPRNEEKKNGPQNTRNNAKGKKKRIAWQTSVGRALLASHSNPLSNFLFNFFRVFSRVSRALVSALRVSRGGAEFAGFAIRITE